MSIPGSNDLPNRVEVITSVQRRRRFAPEEKQRIVQETYAAGASVSYTARRHGIAPSMLYQWRRAMEDGGLTAINNGEKVVPQSEVKKLEDRVRRLERLLGQKTEENECLKEAIRIAREKKLISRAPLRGVEDFE